MDDFIVINNNCQWQWEVAEEKHQFDLHWICSTCKKFLSPVWRVSKQLLVVCIGDNHLSSSVKKNAVTASCLWALCWQKQSFREASVVILLKGNELLWVLHDTDLLPSPGKNLSTLVLETLSHRILCWTRAQNQPVSSLISLKLYGVKTLWFGSLA